MTKQELRAALDKLRAEFPQAQRVRVHYNGSGDEGFVEEVRAVWGDALENEEYLDHQHGLYDDFATVGEDAANDSYPGWENNDGGQGYVEIDVATGKVTIHHTWNVMTSEDEHGVEYEVE